MEKVYLKNIIGIEPIKRQKPLFNNIVGQNSVKTKLEFLLANYQKTFYIHPILILGQFGGGKTTFAIELAKNLYDRDDPNKIKKLIKVHGVALQTVDDFFNSVVIPHLSGGCATVFCDEFHNVGKPVLEAFLTILETSSGTTTSYIYNGTKIDFDFTKFSFIASSTESQKIPLTLSSRFEIVELEDYSNFQLAEIFRRALKKYTFDEEVIDEFIKSTKDNPREIQNLAKNVRDYLYRVEKTHLDLDLWKNIYKGLSLKPLGLNNLEIRILQTLKQCPNSSLTKLSAILGLSSTTIRQRHELQLLRLNLMQIKPATGRSLSNLGYKYLEDLDKDKINQIP